ncbi:hypothetical protein D9M68_458610 [compost metagenome]
MPVLRRSRRLMVEPSAYSPAGHFLPQRHDARFWIEMSSLPLIPAAGILLWGKPTRPKHGELLKRHAIVIFRSGALR